MKKYTDICPTCGTENRNLFLEETNGIYECEKCGQKVVANYVNPKTGCVRLPVFDMGKPIPERYLKNIG